MKKSAYSAEQTLSELKWLSQAQTLLGDNLYKRKALGHVNLETQRIKNHHRLGVHFEDIFELYLRNFPQVTDLKSHIQIIEDKKTLGEADFLVCQNGTWRHLEIAIKFYLRVGRTGQMRDYLGPSLTDSLDKKISHIENRQLKLLESDTAKRTLQSLGIDTTVKSYAQVFGWLFYHVDDDQSNIPDSIQPHHPRGRWFCVNELERFLDEYPESVRFILPSRSEWLISPSQIHEIAWSKRDLVNRAQKLFDRPQQLFIVLGEGCSRQLVERVFVVPESWLDKANTMIKQT